MLTRALILPATIITVAAAVYHGEDSIVFALCIFNNRVFRLFRVAFDTRYPNISSYIPFLAVFQICVQFLPDFMNF